VYNNTRGQQFAACIKIHAANWPRVLKYTRLIAQLVSTGVAACIYVATCTRPTVRHVYSDRTRGDLQVAKNNFFCSVPRIVTNSVPFFQSLFLFLFFIVGIPVWSYICWSLSRCQPNFMVVASCRWLPPWLLK